MILGVDMEILVAAAMEGCTFGYGIDYGKESINFSNKVKNKLKLGNKLKFKIGSVYSTKLKSNSFDIAIQMVFFIIWIHLRKPTKNYTEF